MMTHVLGDVASSVLACDDELETDEILLGDVAKTSHQIFQTLVADEMAVGMRLDKWCAKSFDNLSRSQVQGFIEDGALLVNDLPQKAKYTLKQGDVVTLCAVLANHGEDLPERIHLDVVYRDDTVIVLNKPAGLVVHPGAGNRTGTLVNGLLYHFPELATLPRAGLVHRIDKDTTGLLVVACTKSAQLDLINQLKDKSVYRLYQCVVVGKPSDILRHAMIDCPIARHTQVRTKMAVRDGGKPAVTHVIEARSLGDFHSLLKVQLQTGRTHQIRVHLSHVGFALLGDKVYGRPNKANSPSHIRQAIDTLNRQALHAYELGFVHPKTGETVKFVAPLPEDMQRLIKVIESGGQDV